MAIIIIESDISQKSGLDRDVSRGYLGIAVFIGRVTKPEEEGIATLQSSDNIRCHNKI